ncbi:GAF domain-containing protein [Nocardia altamirensis]|uniref:GAF domain-containing protein n=1 Tax=Nocardia altamirensis TaxID=472158 RepID=UPI0008403CBE|nr:GAF domain-containing protein [Nocardia altamirensis]
MSDSSARFRPLESLLEQTAAALGVQSVLVMRSTPTHMAVEATAGAAQGHYPVGGEGKKGAAFTEAQELYCERVVDTDAELFVRDSRTDPDFSGNEDEVEFGLVNYLGLAVHNPDGSVFGTVCVLDARARDYTPEQRAQLAELRTAAEHALAVERVSPT